MAIGKHNLAVLGNEAFERNGDRESLYFEGKWYRSGEMHDRSRRLNTGFRELGIAPGDRVAVLMANCPEVGLVYGGLWGAGAAITPLIFLLPPDEVRRILEDSEASAIVTTPEFLDNVRKAAEGVSTLKWIISLGPEQDGVISLESLEQAEPGEVVPRDDSDLAALMYTGGTTGRAKGVMLSHENLWYCGKSADEASFVPGVKRVLVPLPLSHSFGLIVSVVSLHTKEPGDGILMRWFDPVEWLKLSQDLKVQRGTVVPSMIQILLGQPLEEYDLSSLRFLTSGAAPLAPEIGLEFMRRVPNVQILEGYGCTESGAVISVNPPGAPKLGTVGKVIPGYEVVLRNDDGTPSAKGEPGEVTTRSPGVMQAYWKAPEATAAALKDGWLYTGDIGTFDEDGYLKIVDRKKDLIIRGGFNVFPRDVEDCLLEHPAVALAGVVGRKDPKLGEEVVAFVSLNPGAETTPEELIAFTKDKIGGYKYPRVVNIVQAVPLTPVGKIDRKALRTML
jgi:long-chain acyl-CoA synthetase